MEKRVVWLLSLLIIVGFLFHPTSVLSEDVPQVSPIREGKAQKRQQVEESTVKKKESHGYFCSVASINKAENLIGAHLARSGKKPDQQIEQQRVDKESINPRPFRPHEKLHAKEVLRPGGDAQ